MALDSALDNGQEGFGDPELLNKIDELRRLNVAGMVPLPQLVVVGDQSAGKSSVLEGLTGFPFPRAVNLCTRYATEIICRRDEVKNTTITIRPQPGASADRVAKLQEFKADVTNFDPRSASFQDVFQKAAVAMGLRIGSEKDDTAPAFSEDVLRIEITGPEEKHLTIIDVPGIFEAPEPGVTTKNDIALVKSMVHNYIREPRTVILAVAACPSDIATQQIFERAKEVDPEGKRTLGVLTKPDLLTEQATTNTVVELVKGDRKPLRLGYCVVRNRGADDFSSSLTQRDAAESGFFNKHPWSQLDKARLGIPALRLRLGDLLGDITRREFPIVAREIMNLLKQSKKKLDKLGDARTTSDQQRIYLGQVASKFRDIGQFALDAYYTGAPLFNECPEARMITHIREVSDAFAKTLFSKGHSLPFQGDLAPKEQPSSDTGGDSKNGDHGSDSNPECVSRNDMYDVSVTIPDDADFPELIDLLTEPAICQDPLDEDIFNHIYAIYISSRGQELGTFGKTMLPTVFKEQSRKWKDLTLAHVSNVILIINRFIHMALKTACPDDQVRGRLRLFIRDDLLDCYRRSMDHAEFLLRIECQGKALTCNPEFDKNLQRNKELRHQQKAKKVAEATDVVGHQRIINTKKLAAILASTSEVDQICEDLHDVLKAYYEVARSRFVDAVYQQVVDHFMLSDERSALRVFGPERVLSMTSEQLKTIAEEEASSKRTREKLEDEIACLNLGMRVVSI